MSDELTAEEKDASKAYYDAYVMGLNDERERIVAWLRHKAAFGPWSPDQRDAVERVADLLKAEAART